MSPKTRKIIGWILTVLLGGLFIFSAAGKLMGNAESAKMAAGMGLSVDVVRILGVVELLSILLFAIPRTGVLGTLLLAAYLGGAIATHIEHAEAGAPYMAMGIQAVLWITALIRFPELGWRLMGRAGSNSLKA